MSKSLTLAMGLACGGVGRFSSGRPLLGSSRLLGVRRCQTVSVEWVALGEVSEAKVEHGAALTRFLEHKASDALVPNSFLLLLVRHLLLLAMHLFLYSSIFKIEDMQVTSV